MAAKPSRSMDKITRPAKRTKRSSSGKAAAAASNEGEEEEEEEDFEMIGTKGGSELPHNRFSCPEVNRRFDMIRAMNVLMHIISVVHTSFPLFAGFPRRPRVLVEAFVCKSGSASAHSLTKREAKERLPPPPPPPRYQHVGMFTLRWKGAPVSLHCTVKPMCTTDAAALR